MTCHQEVREFPLERKEFLMIDFFVFPKETEGSSRRATTIKILGVC